MIITRGNCSFEKPLELVLPDNSVISPSVVLVAPKDSINEASKSYDDKNNLYDFSVLMSYIPWDSTSLYQTSGIATVDSWQVHFKLLYIKYIALRLLLPHSNS